MRIRLLQQRDEFLQVVGRHVLVDDDGVGVERGLRDRLEILDRVVAHVLVERGVDAVRTRDAQHQGVAIGRGARHVFRADVTARARLVFDDDGLAPLLGQAFGHQARGDVGGTAGREGHHDSDRARGKVVRALCKGRRGGQSGGADKDSQRAKDFAARHAPVGC
ncbi:hypothetical protein D3C72_1641790 [compost metagenome]